MSLNARNKSLIIAGRNRSNYNKTGRNASGFMRAVWHIFLRPHTAMKIAMKTYENKNRNHNLPDNMYSNVGYIITSTKRIPIVNLQRTVEENNMVKKILISSGGRSSPQAMTDLLLSYLHTNAVRHWLLLPGIIYYTTIALQSTTAVLWCIDRGCQYTLHCEKICVTHWVTFSVFSDF